MQPVADSPADDAAGEEVDDHRQVEPSLPCPDVRDVDAPLLVGCRRGEILVDDVRRDRPGVFAVGRAFEPALLPGTQVVLAHQPRRATPPDGKAIILQLARHPRTAIGAVRQGKSRADMRQHHHVIALTPTGRAILPSEVAALADAEHPAEAVDREILSRPIDELEPHRFPSRAKKAVARFSMSRSCRRISFSRRRRFNSAAISACGA